MRYERYRRKDYARGGRWENMTVHRGEGRAPREREAAGSTAESSVALSAVQITICVLAVVAAAALRFSNTELFDLAGRYYMAVMGYAGQDSIEVGAFGVPINRNTVLEYLEKNILGAAWKPWEGAGSDAPGQSESEASGLDAPESGTSVSDAADGQSGASQSAPAVIDTPGLAASRSDAESVQNDAAQSPAHENEQTSDASSQSIEGEDSGEDSSAGDGPVTLGQAQEADGGALVQRTAGVWESISQAKGMGGECPNTPENLYTGPLLLSAKPVYPAFGAVTSPFGPRLHPITGADDFHTGVDIAAAEGANIYAVLPGTVTEVGTSAVYGNYIILRHGKSLETRYCHCSTVLAETGANIKQGERVAEIGSTGIATGPHLHFEVLVRGDYVDPLTLYGL